ncbi:hypothetical protein [Actinophytocola sp.]|uniref:hypothetical protein n=1 Tax=Actinophytocola sp. TaxID=1872138 RepID=UPI00389A67DD
MAARPGGHRDVPWGSSLTSPRRRGDGEAMHPAARRVVTVVLLVQVAWSLPLGVVLALTVHWSFLPVLGSVALAVLVVLLSFMLSWQRADLRRQALLTRGVRVPALLVASRPTSTRINNRRLLAHTFEARPAGGIVRAETKAFVHLPVGTEATIAYDAADPGRAVVVEALEPS